MARAEKTFQFEAVIQQGDGGGAFVFFPFDTLHAESDWDEDGKALLDEFSDAVSACIAGTFGYGLEVKSVRVVPPPSNRTWHYRGNQWLLLARLPCVQFKHTAVHQLAEEKDAKRYHFLCQMGYDVVVMWEHEVEEDPDRVQAILRGLKA